MKQNNYIQKIILLIIGAMVFIPLLSCNEEAKDLPDEDYATLFGNQKIKPPYSGYETMPKLPCEPDISEEEYIYPGKEISPKRDYTVTLKFYYKEKNRLFEGSPESKSQVMLRYIDENKKLAILKTFKGFEDTKEPDFENGKPFIRTFKAQSGFPIYLGIFGAGWDIFEMKASIQAVSDDGLIQTPEIKYENKLYTDGFSPDFSFCEKIILP